MENQKMVPHFLGLRNSNKNTDKNSEKTTFSFIFESSNEIDAAEKNRTFLQTVLKSQGLLKDGETLELKNSRYRLL